MALGTEPKRKTYLSVTHGKLQGREKGVTTTYSYVDGKVTDIYKKERPFNGSRLYFWYIDIVDKEELYSISFPYYSGAFKSIILSLATVENLSEVNIRIAPYERNGFTKVATYANSRRLSWLSSSTDMETIWNITHTVAKRLRK